ncbi:MAG: winged helix-turn-helix domain-containing protein [Pyrinomonadaceae bacterium]
MPASNKQNRQVETAVNYDDGYLRIEYDNYFVSCNGQRVKMPRAEFMILSRLSQAPNRIVSYEELWNFTWGSSKPISIESLKVYIYHLRRIFEPFNIQFETMVNVGYCFIPFG